MKEIKNKQFTFLEFYQELANSLNEKGELSNLIVQNCIVVDIPKNFKILVYSKAVKCFGFTIYETDGTFFGFPCDHVTVTNNVFKAYENQT